jgi:hypothetical protein
METTTTNKAEGGMASKWTVTSPSGQVLHGELDDGNVVMSSARGNHGSVTLDVWRTKIAEMSKAGYKVDIEE